MAQAAVLSALENLTQLLLNHADLIQDVATQVDSLESDLRLLRSSVKELSCQSDCNASSLSLMKEIRLKVYEIEDAIDAYFIEAAKNKSRGGIFRTSSGGRPPKPIIVVERISAIRDNIKLIMERSKRDSTMETAAETGMVHRIQGMKVREDNVVGFEAELQTIIDYLMEETEELDVISIVGMPGLGKTTLAGKVYRDPLIQHRFSTRAWVTVSQVFNKREVFLDILRAFPSNTDGDLTCMTDQKIVQILRNCLRGDNRFLIVLDDVWGAEAWMNLRDTFPKTSKRGKILITSRTQDVAVFANPNRPPHMPQFLTPKESWELLQLEASGGVAFTHDLQEYQQHIIQKCGGLPLAIVVIGRILAEESSSRGAMATIENTWKKMSENVASIVASSYNRLPYYLRPCFLYLGVFPEDFEIPVQRLIRLWILEGFIQQRKDVTLEQTAKEYLNELINNNLVMVGSLRADGGIKTCRIHSMLREFCKIESGAKKENSIVEFTKSAEGDFTPPFDMLKTCLRICLDSAAIPDFILAKPSGPQVRSFLCFSKEEQPLENVSEIPEAFNLLRVFDAKPVIFTQFPDELTKLVHLRYIVLSSNFKILPETIAELWNLQSLTVYTSSDILQINADIWRMLQLRHVKTNASAVLPKKAKSTKELGEKLQTLGTISPESCTEDVFDRLRGLRKLGIRGRLVSLLDTKGLDKLENLEKLKLINVISSSSSAGGGLPRLPEPNRFPPELRSLTLCATCLDWVHMSKLGMLVNLKVLKLKENAFTGDEWETSAGGFLHLELLHIEHTNFCDWRVADASYFPSLKSLSLRNCENLKEIPDKLSEVQSFHRLDLKHVGESVAVSARKIEEAKRKQQEQEPDAIKRIKFKLYIH